jgi:outer membrane protein OmpA-like peptidoglycan-associated protein
MKNPAFLLAGFLLVLASLNAAAQVTVDPRALAPLKPATPSTATQAPTTQAPTTRPAQPQAARPTTPPAAAKPTSPPAPEPPVMAIAPPGPPVIPPPVAVPTRPTTAPPLPGIAADAPGAAAPLGDGLRVTFGTARSDLNPATEAAIRTKARTAPSTTVFTVTAYAPGSTEDASAPRRLSLSRALAVRSLMISEGIASPRITTRAYGAASPGFADGPPDRVDVTQSIAGKAP